MEELGAWDQRISNMKQLKNTLVILFVSSQQYCLQEASQQTRRKYYCPSPNENQTHVDTDPGAGTVLLPCTTLHHRAARRCSYKVTKSINHIQRFLGSILVSMETTRGQKALSFPLLPFSLSSLTFLMTLQHFYQYFNLPTRIYKQSMIIRIIL